MTKTRPTGNNTPRNSAAQNAQQSGFKQALQSFWGDAPLLNLCADAIGLLALLALGIAFIVAINRLPILPLTRIHVTTPLQHVSSNAIETAARRALSGNFFTLDINLARAKFEELPWVRRAEVRRQWPDSIALAIEEQTPVARWAHDVNSAAQLVNSYGEVFSGAESKTALATTLPLFSGPPGSSAEVLARYRQYSQIIAELHVQPTAVKLSRRQAWELELSDGVIVQLGRDLPTADETLQRLQRFVTYFPLAREHLKLSTVVADMRYPGGYTLRPLEKSAEKTSS